ncbi:MAG: hypothetical protein CL878_14950 [Dehalococcoidia bacterium]|nr:hypothetical protein [Dehalococcoidia bacterium]
MAICCKVELFGVARLRAERREVELSLSESDDEAGESDQATTPTVEDALAALAATCPALVGPVLAPDGRSLYDGYLLSRNGREFIDRTDATISEGDCLLLIASAAGGARQATAAPTWRLAKTTA